MSVRRLLADTGLRARSLLPLKVQDVPAAEPPQVRRQGAPRRRPHRRRDGARPAGRRQILVPRRAHQLQPDQAEPARARRGARLCPQGLGPGRALHRPLRQDHHFGSCFAANVTRHLRQAGYAVLGDGPEFGRSYVVRYGEGMANSFAVAQQFEWAFGEREFDEALWFDKGVSEVGYDESVRAATRAMFLATERLRRDARPFGSLASQAVGRRLLARDP